MIGRYDWLMRLTDVIGWCNWLMWLADMIGWCDWLMWLADMIGWCDWLMWLADMIGWYDWLMWLVDVIGWYDWLMWLVDVIGWYDWLMWLVDVIGWYDWLIWLVDVIGWCDWLIWLVDVIGWYDWLMWLANRIGWYLLFTLWISTELPVTFKYHESEREIYHYLSLNLRFINYLGSLSRVVSCTTNAIVQTQPMASSFLRQEMHQQLSIIDGFVPWGMWFRLGHVRGWGIICSSDTQWCNHHAKVEGAPHHLGGSANEGWGGHHIGFQKWGGQVPHSSWSLRHWTQILSLETCCM